MEPTAACTATSSTQIPAWDSGGAAQGTGQDSPHRGMQKSRGRSQLPSQEQAQGQTKSIILSSFFGGIRPSIATQVKEGIVLLYSALEGPHLEF